MSLSDDLMGFLHMLEKQVNNSPTYEFKISGTTAISTLHTVNDFIRQALALEKAVVPDRLKQPETLSGENVIRLDHWKATKPAQRKV